MCHPNYGLLCDSKLDSKHLHKQKTAWQQADVYALATCALATCALATI